MATDKKRDLRAGLALLRGEQDRAHPRSQTQPHPAPHRIATATATAAVAIADAEGLDALSMNKIAAEFGVSAMALYRYVPGKTELVELMVEAVLTEAPDLTGAGPGWRPGLEE